VFGVVGLSDVQHSAAPFLIRYAGNVGFRYVQSLAKAAILLYSVKTMKNIEEFEYSRYLQKCCTAQNIVTAHPHY